MITLYEKDTRYFNNNGIAVLNDYITDDEITWGLHDQWAFTFKIQVNNAAHIEIEEGQIVKAPTPNFDDPQLFYIVNIERDFLYWSITAIHVYNKVKNIYLDSTLVRDKTITDAVNQIIINRLPSYPFTFYTNKAGAKVDTNFVLVNALEALADESMDNSLLTQTETEFTANNFELMLLSRIGEDRGIDVRYGRDLLSFRESIDAENVVGRIVPTGKDDFVIPSENGGPYISLDDISEIDESYDNTYHKTIKVEFDDVVANYGENEGDEHALPITEAVRQLKRLGEREFTLRRIHEPFLSYDIDFVSFRSMRLSETEKNLLSSLQVIRAGDTITVIDNLGRRIKERLIGYRYSPKRQEYLSVTLANKGPSITEDERIKVLGGGTFTA